MNLYSEFLPFCKDAKIFDMENDVAKGFFNLNIIIGIDDNIDFDIKFEHPYVIEFEGQSKIFKMIKTKWIFKEESTVESDRTLVDYEVSCYLYRSMVI